ncbi:MAG: helix-turn-helix domain-containing protein [Clostridia bacterium]|nr:helix-turn-helix domain-containing protein [Clostridia bacterium]
MPNNKREDTPASFGEAITTGWENGVEFNKRVREKKQMVSERLKALRDEKGITQSELCRQIEVNRITYQSYESGRSEPSIYVLEQLATFYDVSLDYLCCRTSKRKGFYAEGDERQKDIEIETLYKQIEAIQSQIKNLKSKTE